MGSHEMPLYQKVYRGIRDEIQKGTYPIGSRLPAENQLAAQYQVSKITTKKAMQLLVDEGIVRRIRGKGTFVQKQLSDASIVRPVTDHRIIGVILPDFSDAYAGEILKSVEREATHQGLYPVLRQTHGSRQAEEQAVDDLVQLGVMGLIIMPIHGEQYNPKILRLVLDGFPVVFDRRFPASGHD